MMINGDATSHKVAEPNNKPSLQIPFVTVGKLTVSLPLFSLVICFISAIIYQFDEVNKTVCNVPNLVPSISAITGVTPQRYLWRICIALHCTPRLLIGFVYYYYYMRASEAVHSAVYRSLVGLTFWLYTIENACLIGVTYIANVENYPVHEKIFVVFMVTSLLYELVTLIVFKWAHPDLQQHPHLVWSYKLKTICFISIMCFTGGLVYFFLKHRWFCEAGAFTMFSACEYGIAVVNILFHFTAVIEFRDTSWSCYNLFNECMPATVSTKTAGNSDGNGLSKPRTGSPTRNGNKVVFSSKKSS